MTERVTDERLKVLHDHYRSLDFGDSVEITRICRELQTLRASVAGVSTDRKYGAATDGNIADLQNVETLGVTGDGNG